MSLICSKISNGSSLPKLSSVPWFVIQGPQQSVCHLHFCAYLLLLISHVFLEICFKYISTFILCFILFLLSRLFPLSSNKCFLKSPNPRPWSRTLPIPYSKKSTDLNNLTWSSLWKPHSILFLSLILSYSFCSISCPPVQAGLCHYSVHLRQVQNSVHQRSNAKSISQVYLFCSCSTLSLDLNPHTPL